MSLQEAKVVARFSTGRVHVMDTDLTQVLPPIAEPDGARKGASKAAKPDIWGAIRHCRSYLDGLAGRESLVRRPDRLSRRGPMPSAEEEHRSRNLASIVQAVAFQTLRSARCADSFNRTFKRRAEALGRAQRLLAQERRPRLRELIEQELSVFAPARRAAVCLEGPDVPLRAEGLATFLLAIHELAWISSRACECARERVSIYWAVDGPRPAPLVSLYWTAFGVDADAEGEEWAFGRELIEWGLPYAMEAKTRLDSSGGCLACTILLPLPEIDPVSPPEILR